MCTSIEKNLPELLRLLHDARASWESIATQLELSQGDINAIKKKFDDPIDCLRKSLTLWLRGVDPKPTREQLARALQSPPVGREDIAQQVVPGLSRLPKPPKKESKVWLGCVFTGLLIIVLALAMILGVVVLQYCYGDPVDLSQIKSLHTPVLKQNLQLLIENKVEGSISRVVTLPEQSIGADEVIEDNKDKKDPSSPCKSLSLPVLKQELIGREEEMKVIMGYFSEVDVVTLYGQAGFGKSEIALHVGHRMLELGLDVYYIRVENVEGVRSLEKELMEISVMSYTSKRLMKWANGLTKKTLLILDNVDGNYWVEDVTRQHFQLDFLYPLLDYTSHLQVLITSQQDMMTRHAYLSYRIYSLFSEDCVRLMVNHSRNAKSGSDSADTGDLRVICDLVGNVQFASKVLAKTLSSGTSTNYIIQRLEETSSKLKFVASRADKVGKDRLLSAIELAFQFVQPECQISTFLLIKFQGSFTLDRASHYITADMMRSLNYTDFDIYECLLELSAKSFLEVKQYQLFRQYQLGQEYYYHFHELIFDYLKNSNYYERIHYELTQILQVYWKNCLLSSNDIVRKYNYIKLNNNDFDALTEILNHDDSLSFEASIALVINFPFDGKKLISAARVLVSHCEVQGFNYTRLITDDIVLQGYNDLLDLICLEEISTEWNCMDAISLLLPIIDKLDVKSSTMIDFSSLLIHLCLQTGSPHIICGSIWKQSLNIYLILTDYFLLTDFDFYSSSDYDGAIHSLHLTLEHTSSPYDFIAYMALYDIHSRQDNLTGMEESLAGIHKLDYQQIDITRCTYNADFEDPQITTAILFLQQINETNLANKLRSKMFVDSYNKMGCCDMFQHLLNSLY